MCPRPRTISDAEILQAAGRMMARMGPARLTLAHVGRAARLSPGALVKRFGSKRGLLLAMSRQSVGSVEACFANVRSAHPSPLEACVAAALEMTRYVQTPQQVANQLAYLQLDLSDPEFYPLLRENHACIEAGYRVLLEEAVNAGALVPCDAARLARAVGALATGSLLGWAVVRRGTAEAWVRQDLEMMLDTYRPGGRPFVAPARSGRRARRP